jgi:hypothetical protein
MDTDSLSRLKLKLDSMRRERDHLNSIVLDERAKVSKLEVETQYLRNEYIKQKQIVDSKEKSLDRYNETIKLSDAAYNKVINNSDKLLSALESEFSMITNKFQY